MKGDTKAVEILKESEDIGTDELFEASSIIKQNNPELTHTEAWEQVSKLLQDFNEASEEIQEGEAKRDKDGHVRFKVHFVEFMFNKIMNDGDRITFINNGVGNVRVPWDELSSEQIDFLNNEFDFGGNLIDR